MKIRHTFHRAAEADDQCAADDKAYILADGITAYPTANLSGLEQALSEFIFIGFTDDECFTTATFGEMERERYRIPFAVRRAACDRVFGFAPPLDTRWYLPADLRGLSQAVIATVGDDGASALLRAARCTELICALFNALEDHRLVRANGGTVLRERDTLPIIAAHRIVCDEWHQTLTVQSLARRCGLSRSKLMRGFRELYQCTVGEVVAERRLQEARRLLIHSDLHIATVGYRCGYTNNASFSRAFARHFGMTASATRRRARAIPG